MTVTHATRWPISGNHLFGENSRPHCRRAKDYLHDASIDYCYHGVVHNPRTLYEMLARVKPLIGARTPITVTQIWINSHHLGDADELAAIVHHDVIPYPDRGRCSLSMWRKMIIHSRGKGHDSFR